MRITSSRFCSLVNLLGFLGAVVSFCSIGRAWQIGEEVQLPPPHEKIQHRFRYDQYNQRGQLDLTPRRKWQMVDGAVFEGNLIRWCDDTDNVLIQDNNQLYKVPRRRFDDKDGAEVDKLWGEHHQLIAHLTSLPMAPPPAGVKLAATIDKPFGAVLEIDDKWVYWAAGQYFVRTPKSEYTASDLEKLQSVISLVDQPLWRLHSPETQLRGELLGQVRWAGDRTALAFRAFRHPSSFSINGQPILVPQELLVNADQQRALDMLKAKKLEQPMSREAAPPLWWPITEWVGLPGKPTSLNQMQLTYKTTKITPNSDGVPSSAPADLVDAFGNYHPMLLFAQGQLLVMELLEEQRLRTAEPNISDEKLAAAMLQFRDKTIAADPYVYLSPSLKIWLKDTKVPVQGRLVGENGIYWIFESFPASEPPLFFAIQKSELTAQSIAYGERVLKDLAGFLAAHPDVKPRWVTGMQTKKRIARIEHGNLIVEPISINDQVVELNWFNQGPTTKQVKPLKEIHFKDVEEFHILLRDPSDTPEGNVPTNLNDPVSRDKALAASELKGMLARMITWTISAEGSDTDRVPVIAFQAALHGEYQDSFVLVANNMTYLIDPDILTDPIREEAEKQLKMLSALRRRAGVEANFKLSNPPLRCFGMLRNAPLIASRVRIDRNKSAFYRDPNFREQSIDNRTLSDKFRLEFELQLQLDQEFRQDAPPQLSAEQSQKIKEAKQRLRAEKKRKIASAAEEKQLDNYLLKDCPIVFNGRFVKFDQDDAIFKLDNGPLVRVFQVAFTDESRSQMEDLLMDSQYVARVAQLAATPSTDIEYRVMRMNRGGLLLPSIPVGVESERVLVRMRGGLSSIDISKIHPRDVSELRSELYRRTHQLTRDTTIDERLKAPVAKKDIVYAPFQLEDKWKQRIDGLFKPRQLVWTTSELSLAPTEQVLAFSPDSTHMLVAPAQMPLEADTAPAAQPVDLKIVELASGKTQVLKDHYLPGTRAYLSSNNQQVILFAPDQFKTVDVATGTLQWETSMLRGLPLATCQSGDGETILALQSNSKLLIVSFKGYSVSLIDLPGSPLNERRQVSSSYNGEHIAVLTANQLRSYRRRPSSKNATADQPAPSNNAAGNADYAEYITQSFEVDKPMLALGPTSVYLANQNKSNCAVTAPAVGILGWQAIFTGMNVAWIGMARDADANSLPVHLIGKRADPPSQAANYYFSAYFRESNTTRYTTQTLEAELNDASVFDSIGSRVAFKRDGKWLLATQAELTGSLFQPLAGLASELIEAQAWAQVDAAWLYLRSKKFQELGTYPDEASEAFLQTINREVNMFGWQHGGDLDARGEAVLQRWEKLSPDSIVLPTLMAIRERDFAWRARGGGFADTVTEAGAEEFRQRMLSVVEILKPLLKQGDPPTRAYALAYEAAMSLGMDLDIVKNLNRSMMLTNVKYSTSAHSAVVLLLMPRWHGNPGDSENYITNISDRLGGEVGDAMYAQLILFMSQFHSSQEPLSDHVEYDAERFVKGLRAYYKKPHAADQLQRGLRILAKEENWKLVRELVEVQAQSRIYVDQLSESLKTREEESLQAFK